MHDIRNGEGSGGKQGREENGNGSGEGEGLGSKGWVWVSGRCGSSQPTADRGWWHHGPGNMLRVGGCSGHGKWVWLGSGKVFRERAASTGYQTWHVADAT